MDYLKGDHEKTGLAISAGKWFSKPFINIEGNASVYKNQFDYRIGLNKFLDVRPVLKHVASIGLYFERFNNYNDLDFSLSIIL